MGIVIDMVLMFLATVGAIAIVACGVAAVFALRYAGKIRRLSRRTTRALKGFLQHWEKNSTEESNRHFDRVVWPQVESLLSLYRIMDGRPTITPTRRWAASPDFILRVIRHVEAAEPKVIVECSTGTSTIAIATALRQFGRGGHVYAIENHPQFAEATRQELESRGLSSYATIITAPLAQFRYEGFENDFNWYGVNYDDLPKEIDLLVIDGPFGGLNPYARYPAGPQLFPRLTRDAHVFLDDASRRDEAELPRLWRSIYPDLGVREHVAEKGMLEFFFLDRKMETFLPEQLKSESAVGV